MAALPSFIELMSSLGLDNDDAKPATPSIVRTRDRSSSCSSCSSMGSSAGSGSPSIRYVNLSTTRDIESDRRPTRLRAVRYSPYISASVRVFYIRSVLCLMACFLKSTARQSSTISLTRSQSDQEQLSRVSHQITHSAFLLQEFTVSVPESEFPSIPSIQHTAPFIPSLTQERIYHPYLIICAP